MSEDIIPEDARQFFLNSVDSIAQWEGVLLLRLAPDQSLSASELAARLYIGEDETANLLAKLVDNGIVERLDTAPPTYRYGPQSEDLAALISKCAELYRQYLIPVTRIIHSAPRSRVQEFANAFRIRKD